MSDWGKIEKKDTRKHNDKAFWQKEKKRKKKKGQL